jgi:Zn-dependent protease with chaperone function
MLMAARLYGSSIFPTLRQMYGEGKEHTFYSGSSTHAETRQMFYVEEFLDSNASFINSFLLWSTAVDYCNAGNLFVPAFLNRLVTGALLEVSLWAPPNKRLYYWPKVPLYALYHKSHRPIPPIYLLESTKPKGEKLKRHHGQGFSG